MDFWFSKNQNLENHYRHEEDIYIFKRHMKTQKHVNTYSQVKREKEEETWCNKSRVLTFSWRRPISYRNQSIDLLCKSMDWFLFDIGLRHERVKLIILSFFTEGLWKSINNYRYSMFIWYFITLIFMTVCSYHVTYAFRSESTIAWMSRNSLLETYVYLCLHLSITTESGPYKINYKLGYIILLFLQDNAIKITSKF